MLTGPTLPPSRRPGKRSAARQQAAYNLSVLLIPFRFLACRLVVDIVFKTTVERNCLVKFQLSALVLAALLLAGCDQGGNDAKHIKVGVINGAEQDVAEVAKKVAKEKYGLDVELVGFSGSLLPNDATNQGEL